MFAKFARLGVSHSPLLTLDWSEWQNRANADMANDSLNLSDGRYVTYEQLKHERGEQYMPIATPDIFKVQAAQCQTQLDQLADELQAASPDVVVIVGDDQGEVFEENRTPAIAIYHGAQIHMLNAYGDQSHPNWIRRVGEGYAMDRAQTYSGAEELALDLINGLLERAVDITAVGQMEPSPKEGFGHAFGFIIKRLFRDRPIPVLPVLLNTYYRPGVITAARAFDIGTLLAAALAALPSRARVAVIASGGLSHFVVDEELDRRLIDGLKPGSEHLLRGIDAGMLNSGSSEILNWILVAGALKGRPLAHAYLEPVYRTPAGTGIGVGFACWK